jgi:hypothetical protein
MDDRPGEVHATIAGGVSTANNVEAVQYTCDDHPSRFWLMR